MLARVQPLTESMIVAMGGKGQKIGEEVIDQISNNLD